MILLFPLLKGGDPASRMNTERRAQRSANCHTKTGVFFQVNGQLASEIPFSLIILDSGEVIFTIYLQSVCQIWRLISKSRINNRLLFTRFLSAIEQENWGFPKLNSSPIYLSLRILGSYNEHLLLVLAIPN